VIQLQNPFTTSDEIDDLVTEFCHYRAISDSDLPELGTNKYVALDHFWAAVAKMQSQ
jgi:hypothetical protein